MPDEQIRYGKNAWNAFPFGYEETKEPEQADLLMINTCSIRQLSEDKAFSAIGTWGKWKKDGRNIKIGFCGCVAQQKANEIFKRAPYVDFVLGTHKIYALPEIIKKLITVKEFANVQKHTQQKTISQTTSKSKELKA